MPLQAIREIPGDGATPGCLVVAHRQEKLYTGRILEE